ncbi:hypothetical protein F5144DRAFT_654764 [Chaetomium tenue]|uniref:Uncharacterized protein n=1 Tax=Chaetomium tenue TaxID=1854479 RepID=A0ACB7P5B2_9PEZI|nr:hypothetical protein F5144DRAFT_654764 [Chaetomium globosum]
MVNLQITARGALSSPNATSVCYTLTTYCFTPEPLSSTPSSAASLAPCPAIGTPTVTITDSVTSTHHSTVTTTKSVTLTQHTSSAQSSAQSQVAQVTTWPTQSGLAAISVATAAVALIIGAVAMLYFVKSRAKKLARVRASDGSNLPHDTTELVDLSGVARARSDSVPRSVSDSNSTAEVISGLQDLSTKIQDHVESTYSLEESQISDGDGLIQAIARLPFLKHDAQFLAYLCSFPGTRHAALRHLIAVTLLSAIDFGTFHDAILLPPVILAFWATLPSPRGDKQRIEALWHWQKLSMGLLQHRPTSTATTTPDIEELTSIQPQISKLHDLLAPILSHFAFTTSSHYHGSNNGNNNGESSQQAQTQAQAHSQTPHPHLPLQLHDLLTTATTLGRTLLSQPHRFTFDWHTPTVTTIPTIPTSATTTTIPNRTRTRTSTHSHSHTTYTTYSYNNTNRDELVLIPALVRVSEHGGGALEVPERVREGEVVDSGEGRGGEKGSERSGENGMRREMRPVHGGQVTCVDIQGSLLPRAAEAVMNAGMRKQ